MWPRPPPNVVWATCDHIVLAVCMFMCSGPFLRTTYSAEEEATTTGRMDYMLSDFHVVHCNANDMFGLSKTVSVGSLTKH